MHACLNDYYLFYFYMYLSALMLKLDFEFNRNFITINSKNLEIEWSMKLNEIQSAILALQRVKNRVLRDKQIILRDKQIIYRIVHVKLILT